MNYQDVPLMGRVPDPREAHLPPGDLSDGHLFVFAVSLRGVHRVVDDPTWYEDGYIHEPHQFAVREHSLSAALRKAADLPFSVLMGMPHPKDSERGGPDE